MFDAFLRVVSAADACGMFLSNTQIDALQTLADQGETRIKITNQITANASGIVVNAARSLFAEQPQLIAPGGNAYTSRRMAACLRDMEIILRYVTYAIFSGDASVLEDRCLNGLRETYIALGVPCASVAASIQKMKEVTLVLVMLVIKSQIKENSQDLALPAIRKLYPKQWVTIEVTEFKGGFPSRGQVLFYDSDISRLSNKISKLNGETYTFFTSRIDDKPDPQLKREIDSKNQESISIFSNLSPDYSSLISELSSYFDRAIASIV